MERMGAEEYLWNILKYGKMSSKASSIALVTSTVGEDLVLFLTKCFCAKNFIAFVLVEDCSIWCQNEQ